MAKIETQRIKLTPKLAAEWLELVPPHQRTLNDPQVTKLAYNMTNGRWRENGDTVTFDTNGHLFDGQHRCHAVIRSDVSIWVLVVHGVDPDAFDTKDIGKRRNPGDIFSIAGITNATASATSSRMLMICEQAHATGVIRYVHADSNELLAYAKSNLESVELATTICKRLGRRISGASSVAAALAWIHRYSAERAVIFTDGVVDGMMLQPDSPALILRNHLLDRVRLTTSLSTRRIAETVAMFSAFARGSKVRAMAPINEDADGATFMPILCIDERYAIDVHGRKVVPSTAHNVRRLVAGSPRAKKEGEA